MGLEQRVRALLEWELALGSVGIPAHAPVSRAPTASPTATANVRNAKPDNGQLRLQQIEAEVRGCSKCGLHRERTHTVFARGNPNARLLFVGEGPGFHEDQQGIPFVGPSGELLDKMIAAMNLTADDIYICNVVKCRPPENRAPLPDEVAACSAYLNAQLETVAPKVIVALGRSAAEALSPIEGKAAWRGVWTEWRGTPMMSTYHPAYLLRDATQKRVVWDDLKKVMSKLSEV